MKRLLVLFSVIVFVACSSNSDSKVEASKLEQGKKIASESFQALSGKLMKAMGAGGPEGAVEFCNLEAYPLTDSLSKHFGVTIKRSALKYRNAQNKPDSSELAALVKYSEEIGKGVQPKPYVVNVNGKERFIAPIPTKALCLSCHGVPGVNITESVEAKINESYPNDMAIGFQEGDLRGIWSITFNE
jgi:hypothetical protein